MKTLTIEVEPQGPEQKSRRFSASLLAYICADEVWDGGRTDTRELRPVYLAVAGTETTLRPLLANLRAGRKALIDAQDSYGRRPTSDKRIELLRSAGYEYSWQRLATGICIVTVHLPELFAADPGMVDTEWCRFVSAPPAWWAERVLAHLRDEGDELVEAKLHARALKLVGTDAEVEDLAPRALHFLLCVDRRTRRPVINTVAFAVQLYLAAQKQGLARLGGNDHRRHDEVFGTADVGLCPHIIVRATHAQLDALLAEQVRIYREASHGQA